MSIPTICNRLLIASTMGAASGVGSYAYFEAAKRGDFGGNPIYLESTKVGSLLAGISAVGVSLGSTSKRPAIALPVAVLTSLYVARQIGNNTRRLDKEEAEKLHELVPYSRGEIPVLIEKRKTTALAQKIIFRDKKY